MVHARSQPLPQRRTSFRAYLLAFSAEVRRTQQASPVRAIERRELLERVAARAEKGRPPTERQLRFVNWCRTRLPRGPEEREPLDVLTDGADPERLDRRIAGYSEKVAQSLGLSRQLALPKVVPNLED